MKESRPLIGIAMRYKVETERFYLARSYAEAIEAAGGLPVHVPLIPRGEYIAELMKHLDGILLPGSASDVNPLEYGQEPHPSLGSVHTLRDATDKLMLNEAERMKTPVLAICYGLQALNVHRGGTLIQDIKSQIPHAIKHQQGEPRAHRSHTVKVLPGSMMAGLAKADRVMVNSHHHQAIATLGRNLRAAAWTDDGLIEAIEDTRPSRFALGVQWHPEIDFANDELSQAIFGRLVSAANNWRLDRGQQESEGSRLASDNDLEQSYALTSME